MKKKGLFYASIKSLRLGARLAPKAFWGLVTLSLLDGFLSLATIGSFSLLVNQVVAMIKVSGFQNLGIAIIVHQLFPYLLLLLASYFIPSVITTWKSYFEIAFSEKFMTAIQVSFVKKQASMDAATLESSEYQDKIQQGNEWGKGSISTLVMRNLSGISSLISIIVTLLILLSIDPRLALMAVLSALPLYYIEQKFSRELFRIRRLNTDSMRIIGNRLGLFHSQYSLIELNMFGSSSKFADEVSEHMDSEDKKILNLQKRKNIFQTVLRVYTIFFSISSGVLVLQRGIAGILPVGSMVFAFSAYDNFYGSVRSFFGEIAFAQDATRYALIWFDIFDTQPIIITKENALVPKYTTPPKIEFVDVAFKYAGSETNALENISFVINPGDKLAVVGLSGAGKTTLIKLLSRVYDPTEGTILVDGVDLRDIDVEYWHNCLAVMFQNYGRYNVSVEESVALGRDGKIIDNEKVAQALEMAGAKTFVENLKSGIKQLIWKGFKNGTDLSGGEHQRIAISRIFYRDALISVLDEPTSSVDVLTAQMIFKNLEEKMVGRTAILISHNFSTVQESSNILVLENGTIIEQGTHEELYVLNGRYAQLYNSQANAFEKKELV